MTVRELIEQLQALTEEQQALPVWVYSSGESTSAPADDVEVYAEDGKGYNARPARVLVAW